MMNNTKNEAKTNMTTAALRNAEEVGCDFDADVEDVRAGRITPKALLKECLEGADEDRVQGWRDYVRAVTDAARG